MKGAIPTAPVLGHLPKRGGSIIADDQTPATGLVSADALLDFANNPEGLPS